MLARSLRVAPILRTVGESFEMTDPDRFTAGTVGPPGERVFYLQASESGHTITLRLEKQQVAALCDYLAGMLTDLPPTSDGPPPDLSFDEPDEPAWLVGTMGVAYEQEQDRILLLVEELTDSPDTDEIAAELLAEQLDVAVEHDPFDVDSPATARFHLPRQVVAAFIEHGLDLVTAGRPTCDLCGGPMDPGHHACPRLN